MNDTLLRYQRWTVALSATFQPMHMLLRSIPYLSLPQRKAVLDISRVQAVNPLSSVYADRHSGILLETIDLPATPVHRDVYSTTLRALIRFTQGHFTPILAGLLSSVARSAPFADYSFLPAYLAESFVKEISAAVQVYHPVCLDYRPWFSSEPRHRAYQVNPGITHSTLMENVGIYIAFCSARSKLQNMRLYPKIGKKSVGRSVMQNYWQECSCRGIQADEIVTCGSLERLYHVTGHEVAGPVEMRYSWKYNVLKPRVYYARGGISYYCSRYVQAIFNVIVDSFPECHRKERFSQIPGENTLAKDEDIMVYDYSSFTSKMDEVTCFIRNLAEFMKGTIVEVVDTRIGLTTIDIGEYLHAYLDQIGCYGEFEVPSFPFLYEQATIFRHTCGMLGIPGNISSCTTLHGLHTRCIVGSDNSKTVGDDAKVRIKSDSHTKRSCIRQLQSLGEVHPEKTASFSYVEESIAHTQTWQYIKRPISRIRNRMFQGRLLIFPTLDLLVGITDHNRRTSYEPHDTIRRVINLASVWNRLLRSIAGMSLQDFERDLLEMIQIRFLETYKMEIASMRRNTRQRILVPWIVEKESFGKDYSELVEEVYGYYEEVEVQASYARSEYDRMESTLSGHVFQHSQRPIFSLLVDLGYVESEPVRIQISRFSVGEESFRWYLDRDFEAAYQYTIVKDLPDWSRYIIDAEY